MTDYNIKKYIDEFCKAEKKPKFDNISNELEIEYCKILDEKKFLLKLINYQKNIIKSLSKQKSTKDKYGLSLRLIELTNTIWRKIINVPQHQIINSDNQYYFNKYELSILSSHFTDYISKLKYSIDSEISEFSFNIYFDVTSSIDKNYTSGIQRVVYELGKELIISGAHPIFLHDEKAYSYNSTDNMIIEISFNKNDCILFLDHSWDFNNSVAKVMNNNKDAGGINICLVYDIIPLNYPEFFDISHYNIFKRWFETITKSDLLLCISPSVASDVSSLCTNKNLTFKPQIEFFNLGADFEYKKTPKASDRLNPLINSNTQIFLSVGTLEPRKGYSVAIDAVEVAWSRGYDFTYVIVGRVGQFQDKLIQRITSHSEYGSRLFWFNDLNDEELSLLYVSARSLIFPSIVEGFGLPLIEAAYYGLPTILSDIDVFRVIAGDHATYFDVADKDMLSKKLIEACATEKKRPEMTIISWRDSKDMMMKHVLNFAKNQSI